MYLNTNNDILVHETFKTLWDGAKCLNREKLKALNIYFRNG